MDVPSAVQRRASDWMRVNEKGRGCSPVTPPQRPFPPSAREKVKASWFPSTSERNCTGSPSGPRNRPRALGKGRFPAETRTLLL